MSAVIALVNPKFSANVASVLRTADCFGVNTLLLTGHRYSKHSMDTSAAYSRVSLIHTENLRDQIPFDHIPVAIEIVEGCDSLPKFTHPRNVIYVFGPEDGSLSREHLSFCKNVIRIPTLLCLNLAVCVGVVLYDRTAKIARGEARSGNPSSASKGQLAWRQEI